MSPAAFTFMISVFSYGPFADASAQVVDCATVPVAQALPSVATATPRKLVEQSVSSTMRDQARSPVLVSFTRNPVFRFSEPVWVSLPAPGSKSTVPKNDPVT